MTLNDAPRTSPGTPARLKGWFNFFDGPLACGWASWTDQPVERLTITAAGHSFGWVPCNQPRPDSPESQAGVGFHAPLGGLLQFSASAGAELIVELRPDGADGDRDERIGIQLSEHSADATAFSALLLASGVSVSDSVALTLRQVSAVTSDSLRLIFEFPGGGLPGERVRLEFFQPGSGLTDAGLSRLAIHECGLQGEFTSITVPAVNPHAPLLISVLDGDGRLRGTDCIPYPHLCGNLPTSAFIRHGVALTGAGWLRCLSRISTQMLGSALELARSPDAESLTGTDLTVLLIDAFDQETPENLAATVAYLREAVGLRKARFLCLRNPAAALREYTLCEAQAKPGGDLVWAPCGLNWAEALTRSLVLLLAAGAYPRRDLLGSVLLQMRSGAIADDFVYWDSIVNDRRSARHYLLKRAEHTDPESSLNRPVAIHVALARSEFLLRNVSHLLRLCPQAPDIARLGGLAERPLHVDLVVDAVEVPLAGTPNKTVEDPLVQQPRRTELFEDDRFAPVVMSESTLVARRDVARAWRDLAGVSVLVNFRNRSAITLRGLRALKAQAFHGALQVVLVNNRSHGHERDAVYRGALELFGESQVVLLDYDRPFNHSAQCNLAASAATHELVLMLNNDVLLSNPDTVSTLALYALTPGVATAGCRMAMVVGDKKRQVLRLRSAGFFLKGDPRIQYGGCYVYEPEDMPELLRNTAYSSLGNTFALAMLRKDVYSQLGELDPDAFPTDYNDVDFCLRAGAKGYRHITDDAFYALHAGRASRADASEYPASSHLKKHLAHMSEFLRPLNFFDLRG